MSKSPTRAAALSVAVLAGLASTSFADVQGGDLIATTMGPIKTPFSTTISGPENNVVAYNNLTTFKGTGLANGGATTTITRLLVDDATPLAGTPGLPIQRFGFSVANFDTATFTARPRVRFYADDGAGGPGAYLFGISFNPVSFTGGQILNLDTGPLGPTLQWNWPTANGGVMWAGMTFDNSTATATTDNLNNLGMGIFDPPSVGSSADKYYLTTAPGSFVGGTLAGTGTLFDPGGLTAGAPPAPVNANFGWSFNVPEPTTLGAVALAAAGLFVRRRK